MTIKKHINGQWSARLIEMLESPAYRALSLSGHRLLSRIGIEHAHHGGNDNGRLPVTKQDFIDYGISHDQVAPAIREVEALGFIQVRERGRGGNAEHRQPNKFFLTFDARAACANKSADAVRFAQRRSAENRNRSWNPGLKRQIPRSWIPGLQGRAGIRDHYLYLGRGGAIHRPGLLSLIPVIAPCP